MLDRREFMKGALSAGVAWGAGSIFYGCSGLKRKDVPDFQKADGHVQVLDDTARAVLYHASLAPSGHNGQPWRVRIERPDMWILEADPERQLPVVDPENRELMLSLGAFVENLSLAAGVMGFSTEIKVVAQSRHDRDVVRFALHEDHSTNYPLQRLKTRRTVKQGYLAREITAADVKALSDQTEGHLSYFPKGSKHAACIRDAAVENYRVQTGRDDAQKELVRWLRLSDRDARQYRDGLSTEGMEIQGFKGWFVRHFVKPVDFMKEPYRRQGVDLISKLAQQGGGWFVISSAGQTVPDLIETGRRFERMALLAREYGIAMHPMTQVLEEKSGMSLIADHHGKDLFPQFLLRVGYLETYPEPVSLRRPVEWFVYT